MSIEDIRHLYNDFSRLFFMGNMPSVSNIMFIFDSTPIEEDSKDAEYLGYTYINHATGYSSSMSDKYPEQYKYVLAINDKAVGEDMQKAMSVVAHEMVHIYQFEHNFDKYSSPNTWRMQHNRLFIHKMNFINSIAPEFGYNFKISTLYYEDN